MELTIMINVALIVSPFHSPPSRIWGTIRPLCADRNAETDDASNGPGTMEAVYFGSAKGGLNHGGVGTGPWIMADLEAGLWGSDVSTDFQSLKIYGMVRDFHVTMGT